MTKKGLYIMKKFNLFKKLTTGMIALIVGVMLYAGMAHASATTNPYTGPSTNATPVPTFDSYVPTPGYPLPAPAPSDGEPDFLQGRVPVNNDPSADSSTPYSDPVNSTCSNNQIIQLRVYVHNNADSALNNNGTGPSVMHGTKVKISLPGDTTQSTKFVPDATLSANNAASVNDTVTINCSGQPVELQYVAGSASQYSIATNTVTPLSDSIVTSGAPIMTYNVPGDVWGCWNQRVLVVISVKIVVPKNPVVIPPTCNLITLDSDNKTVTVKNVSYTAGSSTVNNLSLNYGDGSSQTINFSQLPVSHTYSNYGKYTVTATLNTSTGKVTSNLCSAIITVSKTPVPPTPPTPVTPLPNTGPGDVIGIFAIVTIIGAIAHRIYTKRVLAKS